MTLTDILTAHRAIPMTGTHSGWFWCRECHEYFTTLAAHAVHVVEEMAAANIVAIELPEPSRVIRHEDGDAFPPHNLRVVAAMLAKLEMDTPTDQKITDDFVTMLRNMADNTARLIYPGV